MTTSFMRTQLKRLQEFAGESPIAAERQGQELVGRLLRSARAAEVKQTLLTVEGVPCAMLLHGKAERQGAVLYLHGGGYCCGALAYATGFGSALAQGTNVPVLCPAYRLAPERPYPAALKDAAAAYRFLLERYPAKNIAVVGESAGGGLTYSLCLYCRQEGLPLPGGLIVISPWTDLTASGASYRENADVDPSMTVERLQHFARLYVPEEKWREPLVSPLFGDLTGFPPSLIFVGGDEIMRDDAVQLHRKLRLSGCESTLEIAPGMWHGYVLYGLKERQRDMDSIRLRIRRITK